MRLRELVWELLKIWVRCGDIKVFASTRNLRYAVNRVSAGELRSDRAVGRVAFLHLE